MVAALDQRPSEFLLVLRGLSVEPFNDARSLSMMMMMQSEAEQRAHYERCRDGAQYGDVGAMMGVGDCYNVGIGVERSAEDAMFWYHKAAVQGHPEAQFRLASFYFCGNATGHAAAFEVTPDKLGSDNSIHEWAQAHWWSKPAKLDEGTILEAALKWYRAAAAQGHVEAMHDLGCRLLEFPGADEKPWHLDDRRREAFSWFDKAAMMDHPGATYRLGLCYQVGNGVRANNTKATELFQKAVDLGEPLASLAASSTPSKNITGKARRRARKAERKGIVNLDDPDDGPTTSTDRSFVAQMNAEIALGTLRCANCGRHEKVDREPPFKKCAKCKQCLYCSKECQTYHWRHGGHKLNCTPASS